MATPLSLQLAVGNQPSPTNASVPKVYTGKDYLPEVDVNQLIVWNSKRRKCCGYLSKKGGSSGKESGMFKQR